MIYLGGAVVVNNVFKETHLNDRHGVLMKKTLAILAMILSPQAFAGGVSDGGGDAVVCKDESGKVVSAELFDLFESRVLYNFKAINQDHQDPLQTALAAAKKIDFGGAASDPTVISKGNMSLNLNQRASDFVQVYTRYINQNLQILPPGVGLKPIDDENNLIIPTSCDPMQLAHYEDNTDKIYASGDIWKFLSATHKAGLLVHEALYKKLRMNGETTSERARKAVGAAFAGKSLTSLIKGVPEDAKLCWSKDDESKFRFAIYPSTGSGSNQKAVYQFFRFDGKVPLTKTSIQTDLEFSPLKLTSNVGLSAAAAVQDSILDKDYKIYWTLQRKSSKDFEMTLGNAQKTYAIQCNDSAEPPNDIPWPWEAEVGKVEFDTKRAYLIDATGQSCYDHTTPGGSANMDIAPHYFSLYDFSIDWYISNRDLYVVAIRVQGVLPGGSSYDATIAGKELASLNGTHGMWNGVIPRKTGAGTGVFKASCPPRFGGLHVTAGTPPFRSKAKVSITGFSRDDAGKESPERIEKDLELIYQ